MATSPNPQATEGASARPPQYVVVARRYRPQTFEELVGQEHIARALSNAISTQRVGHAYLFTGARGVGKTSAARILAKALNCTQGPAPVPCNRCDICERISAGDDVDVLEIDGASNRGIDEIRQLRQNVNIRPSRERFKVYIIDEVHMLTREAFNALLKTLEEPPEHVKFILCTTEPAKVPITILSRCQRFDFAGIRAGDIARRLGQIVEAEGVSSEPEALELLARRATGSMRDGQSLLEQLLAFAPERVTVADVHGMLGTAGDDRLIALLEHISRRETAAALRELDAAAQEGIDLSQLLEQLLGYLRDCMVAAAGGPEEVLLHIPPGSRQKVTDFGKRLGLETVLAAMQILDQTLNRLRFSTQGRILTEMALVRVCNLENLAELPDLIGQIQSGAIAGLEAPPRAPAAEAKVLPEAGAEKKSPQVTGGVEPPARVAPPQAVIPRALTQENVTEVWSQAVGMVSGFAAEQAKHFSRIATPAPNRLVVTFKPGYTLAKSICERPDQKAKFEQALAELTGQDVRVEFHVMDAESPSGQQAAGSPRALLPQQRLAQAAQHPMVRRAAELFGADPVWTEEPPEGK